MSQVDHEAQIKTFFLNGRCTRLRCAPPFITTTSTAMTSIVAQQNLYWTTPVLGEHDVFLWHYLCQRKFINKVILFCFEWYASLNSEQKVFDMLQVLAQNTACVGCVWRIIYGIKPSNGCFSRASCGLVLNHSLLSTKWRKLKRFQTTKMYKSHFKIWKLFTRSMVHKFSYQKSNVPFLVGRY